MLKPMVKNLLRRFDINFYRGPLRSEITSDGQISYSQCGEDRIVDYIFHLRGIHSPTFLDIGAFDPFHLSNTALFYRRGCTGINVEPNPALIAKFREARPRDINLGIAVGPRGVLDFYVMEDPTLSTLSREEALNLESKGKKLSKVIQIEVLPLAEIIDRHAGGIFPDFLSMDVEGFEIQILREVSLKAGPKVICIETAEYSCTGQGAKRTGLMRSIEEMGYELYADTNLNSIYVRRDFWRICGT
jgi:FkbM family methyltransferase